MSRTVQEKDEFYTRLYAVISSIQHKDKLVTMVDFNSKKRSGILGPHSIERMNSNGLHLLWICREFQLIITSLLGNKPTQNSIDASEVQKLVYYKLSDHKKYDAKNF